MTRKLHPSARTNAKRRREIQQSRESARRLLGSPETEDRVSQPFRASPMPQALRGQSHSQGPGRKAAEFDLSEARKGPKRPVSTVLSAADEALIVVFGRSKPVTMKRSPIRNVGQGTQSFRTGSIRFARPAARA